MIYFASVKDQAVNNNKYTRHATKPCHVVPIITKLVLWALNNHRT